MDGDARSRRASTGSEAGPRRIDPKPSILLACRVLRAVGVGSLTAELLRRAKFDKPEAAWPLWQALHDLIVLSAPPEPGAPASPAWEPTTAPVETVAGGVAPVVQLCPHAADSCAVMRQLWAQLREAYPGAGADGAADGELPEMVRSFVGHHLACRGYVAAEGWAADASVAASVSPKELLLALGWLLAQLDTFQRYRTVIVERLARLAPMLPPYPQTASALPFPSAGLAAAEAVSRHVSERVARCLQAPSSPKGRRRSLPGADDPQLRLLKDRAAQILAEHGRLLLTARELGALQSERVKLQHRLQLLYRRLHQIEDGAPTPRDYTPYELRLLVDPQLRARHAAAQSEAAMLVEELHACDGCLPTFWRWLQALLPPAPEPAPTAPLAQQHSRSTGFQGSTGGVPTRQDLLDQLAQEDLPSGPEPEPEPEPEVPREIDWRAGLAAMAEAEIALDEALFRRTAQIQSLRAAQTQRAGGVEGVGSNLSAEELARADQAVRATLPDLGGLLATALSEQVRTAGDRGQEVDADNAEVEVEADAGVGAGGSGGYRPSGLVRLADWKEEDDDDSSDPQLSTVSSLSSMHDPPAEATAEALAAAAASAAGVGRRRYVPHVKPPVKIGGASPYGTDTTATISSSSSSSAALAGGRSRGKSKGAQRGRGRGRGMSSHRQWEQERENARLQRSLPAGYLAAGGKAAAARAAAAERSAALRAELDAKIAAAEVATAGGVQRLEALRESHLGKLRAVWDDFTALHPESGLVARE
jgi:hypothetical protein